jgi:hypothetical protein
MKGHGIVVNCKRCEAQMLYCDLGSTAIAPFRFDRICNDCITVDEWEAYWRDMGWDVPRTKKLLCGGSHEQHHW